MTAEQKARDMLERIGVENTQSFSAGDLVELANLIDNTDALSNIRDELTYQRDELICALGEIIWSNDDKWRVDRAKEALAYGIAKVSAESMAALEQPSDTNSPQD